MKRLAIFICFLFLAGCSGNSALLKSAEETGYQGAYTGVEIDQAAGIAIDVGATTGILKSDGSDTISAATAGTDYVAPTSSGNISFTPGSGYDVRIIPLGEGDGLSIFDVGSDYSVTLNVANGTTRLGLTGSLYLTDDLIFDTDSKISHITAGDFLTFKVAAGIPEIYLNAPITNMGSINLDAADDYQVGSSAWLDDTAGNGDTGNLWSADKIYDQLALKSNLASPTFTGTLGADVITATGAITGLLQTATDGDAHTLTSAEYHGGTVLATGAGIYTLPTATAGLSGCVEAGVGITAIIQLLPGSGDIIVHKGAELTAATSIKSPGTAGDRICYRSYDSTYWYVTTYSSSSEWAE